MLPFAGFIDTLRLAADEGDRSRPLACRWTVMAPDLSPIRASCGVEITPWEKLGHPERFHYVVVIGGLLPEAGSEGTGGLDRRTEAFLQAARRRGVGIIGICTGSFALIEAGVLPRDSRTCVSWYHYQDLVERHPEARPVADRLWLREGNVITCAGGTAAIDLAASLVQQHLGGAAAQKSLHIMVTDQPRIDSAAQPRPANTAGVQDARVRRAMLLLEQSLAAPPSMEALAAQLAISVRQMERLFRRELGVSPQHFARDLRLSYAAWRMAETRDSLTTIALQCGFADPAHLHRQFRGTFGCAPSAARRLGAASLHRMLAGWWPYASLPSQARPPAEERPAGREEAATAGSARVGGRRPYR